MATIQLLQGDCLACMPLLASGSIDAVICDPPFGNAYGNKTNNPWDTMIPFAPMWAELQRLVKPHGAMVFFGSQPFTSLLITSNLAQFKWADVWYKSHATGHLNCKVMPLRQHEDIVVFAAGTGKCNYYPQLTKKPLNDRRNFRSRGDSDNYGNYRGNAPATITNEQSYPRSVLTFNSPFHGGDLVHPTQKPLDLLLSLVNTYSLPGQTVLDLTMGSATTGLACLQAGRNFIGIESDATYFQIAVDRLALAQQQIPLFDANPLPVAPSAIQVSLLPD